MKIVLVFIFLPLMAFSQLTAKDSLQLKRIISIGSDLSESDYKNATEMSKELLVKYPNDSLVMLTQVRLYNMYVKKSKCSEYLVPKNANICEKALRFYKKFDSLYSYPRINLAIGNVYYVTALYKNYSPKTDLSNQENRDKAIYYFNRLLKTDLADFEKREIDLLILRMQ